MHRLVRRRRLLGQEHVRDHRLAAIRGGKGDRLDAPLGMRILRRFGHRLDRRPVVAEEAAIGVEHRVGGWRLSV